METSLTRDILFPTPVYHTFLEDFALLNVYTKSRLYSLRDRERGGAARSGVRYSGTWYSPSNMYEMKEFRLLADRISTVIATIFDKDLQLKNSHPWCTCMRGNISDRFGYDNATPNTLSVISGIYYVQTPVNCGGIEFQDPRSSMTGGSDETADGALYQATAGQLIVFPSWLPQKVHPNSATDEGFEGDLISIRFGFGIATDDNPDVTGNK